MSDMILKGSAQYAVSNYKAYIERIKYDTGKNRDQMDLENVSTKTKTEDICACMINACDRLLSELDTYTFE